MKKPVFLPLLMAAAGVLLAAVAMVGILQNRFSWNFIPSTSLGREVNTEKESSAFSQAGKPAPDFELNSMDGSKVRLSDFRGHPVLINYWATWCPPCREELPIIQERLEKYAPDLVVLAINAGEDPETVENYIAQNDFSFQVLLDPEWKAEALFGIYAYPTSVFIDREGLIQGRYVGGMSEDILDDHLKLIGVEE